MGRRKGVAAALTSVIQLVAANAGIMFSCCCLLNFCNCLVIHGMIFLPANASDQDPRLSETPERCPPEVHRPLGKVEKFLQGNQDGGLEILDFQQTESIVREHVADDHIVSEAAKPHAQVDGGIRGRRGVERGQELPDVLVDQRLQARDGTLGEIRLVGIAPWLRGFGVEHVEKPVGCVRVICRKASQLRRP